MINTLASVSFEVSVIDADGRTVRTIPKRRNLLLNQGLDSVADYQWTQLFAFFAIGTGVTPTSRDSGAITVAMVDGVATASAGFFVVQDVGRLLKLDSGEERYITGYTSATVVAVSNVGSPAASQFTVWYVNDVGLGAETDRFSTLVAGAGNHGSAWNGETGVLSTWITRVSNAAVGAITNYEIGWSPTGGAGNNLTGRALIPGGVARVAGQQLKVKLQLDRTFSPIAPRAVAALIAGWPASSGFEQIESIACSYWDDSGNGTYKQQNVLEPVNYGYRKSAISTDATALRAPVFGSPAAIGPGDLVVSTPNASVVAYAPGSFKRRCNYYFDINSANSAGLRSIGFGTNGQQDFCFRVLFGAAQVKTSDQTLWYGFDHSWNRVLIN